MATEMDDSRAIKSIEKSDMNAWSASKNDEEELQSEGQVEELLKEFSIWSLGALCLALMAAWEAITSVVAAALINGGAPCLFYNYIISFLGSVAIACSLGEIASIVPTAGGQYHWVHAMAEPRQKLVASWVTGWISIGGQIVLTASAAFAAGLQFQALITLNHPDSYIPQRWQGMLFYWLILLYSAAVNIWGPRILPHTFKRGLLSTVYPFLGYGAACHLAEAMPKPARNVPIVMVGSVVTNGIIGLGWALMLLFSLGDLNDLLTSATGFPFIQLFLNTTKSPVGATLMTLAINLTAVFANTASLTAISRTYWAFARDSAAPFSSYFAKVNTKLQIPVRVVVLVTVLEMLLGLIYLGNSTAFNAILSMAVIGMYISYLLPIVYMVAHGRRGLEDHQFGPWKMGRTLGLAVNIVAILWLVLATVFSTFPSIQLVTAQTMNYSTVVLGGWLAFGVVFFVLFGRHHYSGPNIAMAK